jgi:Family of unknown function (DUF6186)
MTTRTVTFAGFAVIIGLGVLWGAFTARRANSLSLGRAVAGLTRSKWGRAMMFLAWAWLGLHLFARGSGAFKR